MALAENASASQAAWNNRLFTLDTATGAAETLDLPEMVEQYSASADGSTVVFSANAPAGDSALMAEEEKVREAGARRAPNPCAAVLVFHVTVHGDEHRVNQLQLFISSLLGTFRREILLRFHPDERA
jgi:hypothetical protein